MEFLWEYEISATSAVQKVQSYNSKESSKTAHVAWVSELVCSHGWGTSVQLPLWKRICSYHIPTFLCSPAHTHLPFNLPSIPVCAEPQRWIQAALFPWSLIKLPCKSVSHHGLLFAFAPLTGTTFKLRMTVYSQNGILSFVSFSFMTSANCYLTHSIWGERFTYKCFIPRFP